MAEIETFGFKVECPADDDGNTADNWSVRLPHQCDAWDIAGSYWHPVPHAEAVAELERFITEATAALEALRERREVQP